MPRTKSEQELDELEQRYLGEPSARHPLVGGLLTLLNPGMGLTYIGRFGMGVAVNFALVSLVALFLVVWAATRFNPVFSMVTLMFGLGGLSILIAFDVFNWCAEHGGDYVLKDVNHSLIYMLVPVTTFLAPVSALLIFAVTHLFSVHVVGTEDMEPTFLSRDRVVVDRLAFVNHPPRPGDVVAYQRPEDERLRFARVIGASGHGAFIHQGLPAVDSEDCGQFRLESASLTQLQSRAMFIQAGSVALLERCGSVVYPVLVPRSVDWGEPDVSEPEDGSLFVLVDNRSSRADSRDEGRLPLEHVVGRVSWVAWTPVYDDRGLCVEWEAMHDGFLLPIPHVFSLPYAGEGVVARFGRRVGPFHEPAEAE